MGHLFQFGFYHFRLTEMWHHFQTIISYTSSSHRGVHQSPHHKLPYRTTCFCKHFIESLNHFYFTFKLRYISLQLTGNTCNNTTVSCSVWLLLMRIILFNLLNDLNCELVRFKGRHDKFDFFKLKNNENIGFSIIIVISIHRFLTQNHGERVKSGHFLKIFCTLILTCNSLQ